jgi:8-oxo-dGTP pyrophosphatase MutT (NUDIX family)
VPSALTSTVDHNENNHNKDLFLDVQGGVDEGEELAAACMRELHEETGMVSAHILHELPGWLTYDFPEALMDKWLAQGRGWGGRYRGQVRGVSVLGL